MKKKILSAVLALTMLLPAFSTAAFAENEQEETMLTQNDAITEDVFIAETGEFGEGFSWTYENGTLTISGEGEMPDFSGINDMPYKECRYYNAKLVIDDGITHIGNFAFADFRYITDVTFGKDVKTIGSQAFYGCTSLKTINFNDGLLEIGTYAFSSCGNKLTEITLPDSLEKIDNNAFNMCWNLATVNISDGITDIGYDIFTNTAAYDNKANWEDGLFYIGNYVFGADDENTYDYVTVRSGTTLIPRIRSLKCKTIYIPESVTTEFDNWYFFDTVIIEGEKNGNIRTLAENSGIPFFGKGEEHKITGTMENISWVLDCDTLTLTVSGEGEMPKAGVFGMDWNHYSRYIETFEVKDGVTSISYDAFPDGMKKLILPESVVKIDDTVFYSTTLVCGKIGSYAEQFAKENGLLFCDENGNVIATGECGDEAQWCYTQSDYKLTISGTGAIYDYDSFYDTPWANFDIEEIEIKDGITRIGKNIFRSDSYGYDWLVIPDSVRDIDNNAICGSVNYTVIYCSEDSYAHSWAEDNQRTHESYGEYQEIEVKNEEELLAAIGSNRKIILADGLYTFDATVELKHRRDLEITAKEVGSAEILTKDGYKPSMHLNHCASVSIGKVILGHTSVSYQEGCGGDMNSSGYVLSANYSKNIKLSECDLYGCGTVAVCLYDTLSFKADKCILRDCREKAVYHRIYERNAKSEFTDCIISGNAYDEEFATAVPNVEAYYANVEFNNCIFLNNYNTKLTNDKSLVTFNDCRFENNAWQESSPNDSGICLNGITWQIVEEKETEWYTNKVLKIGYPLEYEDGNIDSKTGELINYSQYSEPWKRNYNIDKIDLAEGINLGGSCGDNAIWTIKNGVLEISGTGDMDDFESYSPWFDYIDMIESIKIEDGITSIGKKAFSNCWRVKSFEIPKGITKIGEYALPSNNIKEFTVAEGNTSFAALDGVLFNKDMTTLITYPTNKKDEKYTIPSTVKTIGKRSFHYAIYISEIVIPDGVSEIEDDAFFYTRFKTVKIPKSVEKIGENAFYSYNLSEFTVAEENATFSAVDGVLFNKDKTVLVLCPLGKNVLEYTVPDGVLEIGEGAFGDTRIKSIRLSETVTKISDNALMSGSIAKVYIPESVTDISYSAMYYYADTTIICKENSCAQTYAIENHIDYVFEDKIPIMAAELVSSAELGGFWVEVLTVLPTTRSVDGYVVAAIYNFDDTLMAVKKVKVTGDTTEFKIVTEDYPVDRKIKILWWDFDNGNEPLSKPYEERLR